MISTPGSMEAGLESLESIQGYLYITVCLARDGEVLSIEQPAGWPHHRCTLTHQRSWACEALLLEPSACRQLFEGNLRESAGNLAYPFPMAWLRLTLSIRDLTT